MIKYYFKCLYEIKLKTDMPKNISENIDIKEGWGETRLMTKHRIHYYYYYYYQT